MKTKITKKEDWMEAVPSKNEDREEITLTVFAVFFIITTGLLILTS